MRESELKVGQWVIYTEYYTNKKRQGRIKWWNDKWVFVVYHVDGDWDDFQNYTAAATAYDDLKIMEKR